MKNSAPTYRTGFTGICGKVAAVIFFIVATCLFLACAQDDDDAGLTPDEELTDGRTVMVYMVAENSLGNSELKADIKEILQGWANLKKLSGDHLVLYVDDNALPRIYELKKNQKGTQLADLTPVYTYEHDANSSSASQLRNFIHYAKLHYPAQSYGLLMWSHASGWIPSTYDGDKTGGRTTQRRSFGVDNQKNNYSDDWGYQMGITDMVAAIEAEGGVDFMFFDACSMQTIEVAYALRNVTEYVIASPAEIPGPGADYSTMVPAMFQRENYVQQMLSAYYDAYLYDGRYGVVISAVKTEALDAFATEMRGIVQRYKSQLLALDKRPLLNYFVYGAWGTSSPDALDMQAVMQAVLPEAEYEQWREKLNAFVTCQATEQWYSACYGGSGGMVDVIPAQCSGVSMAIPFDIYARNSYRYDLSYLATEWAQAVWNASAGDESGEEE